QVGGVRYGALVAAFAASLIGDLTTRAWGVGHAHYPALTGIGLSGLLLAKVALLGLGAGLAGRLFADAVHGVRSTFRSTIAWEPLRPAIGGALLALILFGTGAFAYAGLGIPMILQSFTGDVPALAFLWKLALTALTLGAGFQGGEVTPLFFIGATLGATLGHLLSIPAPLAAGAGFVAVFAGAANTPLACIIMGAELFGGGALPYLGTACVVAYITSGHAGIYTAQRIAMPKSKSLPVAERATLGTLRESRKPAPATPEPGSKR
ncbi:MAG: voltage-gated chloride channel family protein, partial [Firmicutes bacterium]|nr:voltage-gated chloride channel family protein [Bacillota bacterium]